MKPNAILMVILLWPSPLAWADPPTDVDRADRLVVGALAASPPTNVSRPSHHSSQSSNVGSSNVVRRLCAADGSHGGLAASDLAWQVEGWANYERLWNEFAANPNDSALRRYLGLPIGAAASQPVVAKSSRGRSAPRWLGWRSGSYRQVETPHLQIFSHADEQTTLEVAADLERVYWVWTQVFFPLWEGRNQVALHLADVSPGQSLADHLAASNSRLATRQKLRIVLLKDAADYARTLGGDLPGIAQSTGFYSDDRRTSFFYPSDSADAVASRRHELVHQLFREATPSPTSGVSPGMREGFWLVEGIAGYFESLHFDGHTATLGGWDSPRLQFARYRVFSMREVVAFEELRGDGRASVQRRADLARFYAFAIAYTHGCLDGDAPSVRRWIYQRLAELYQIDLEVPEAIPPQQPERALVQFLRVTDQTLLRNPPRRVLTEVCLAGSEVTPVGLAALPPSDQLTWLDVSRLPVGGDDIKRLVSRPQSLRQLSLEATRVDDALAPWLSLANKLTELDLSATACSDATVDALADHQELRTLWLMGSQVTDACIATLLKLPSIESIDVQRTGVSSRGLATLKAERPAWRINPL